MEQNGTTTGTNIKRRSLDEYWTEAESIMNFLGFQHLTRCHENIGQCVTALINAESTYNEKISKPSTWKFKYILNECKTILTKNKTQKRKLLNNSLTKTSVLDKVNNICRQSHLDSENFIDVKSIINSINVDTFLSDNQKKCFVNYYYLGMSKTDIAAELKISKVRVGQIIKKAVSLIQFKYGKDIDILYG